MRLAMVGGRSSRQVSQPPLAHPPADRLPAMSFFDPESEPKAGWRARAYDIIFQTDTRAGQIFDLTLLSAILLSVIVVCLETVPSIGAGQLRTLHIIEWILTGLFTIEYVMRLVVVREPKHYALSFMGLIDLISVAPTYLGLLLGPAHALNLIRILRLLRVFRVFALGKMAYEGSTLVRALVASRYKIGVFLGTLLIVVVLQGALLYFLEHGVNDEFSSIPRAIYWAIVTLTTVGYGDISPITVGGQAVASMLMLLGYGIIAVPTGIVTAEVARAENEKPRERHVVQRLPRPAELPNTCTDDMPNSAIVAGATDAGVGAWTSPSKPTLEPV
jgi:voltage-gated potassium channel